MSVLGRRLLAVHDALRKRGIPHAFGGAIALAYCTEEPRGTRDLDVNVFVAPADAATVLAALPAEVVATDDDRQRIKRDGQARLWWNDTPIDLFFAVHDFHRPGPFMADAPLQPLRPPMGWASGRQETKFL